MTQPSGLKGKAMIGTFLLLLAGQVQPVTNPSGFIFSVDPRQGVMPAENILLRPGHKNSDDRMFPDLAVKEMRIDGNTLYVRVSNEGRRGAKGPIRVTAQSAENGVKHKAAPARIDKLRPGESRWVPVKFALAQSSVVSAQVVPPQAPPWTLDRSGRGCEDCEDRNGANNVLTAAAGSIARGKPE